MRAVTAIPGLTLVVLLGAAVPAQAQTDPDLEGMPGLSPASPTPESAAPLPATPLTSEPTWPSEVRAGGRAEGRVRVDTQHDREGEDTLETRGRFEMEMAARLSPRTRMVVGGRLDHETRTPELDYDGARYRFDAELREAWLAHQAGSLTLTVGHQTIRWGSVDSNSPNDIIAPVDFREGVLPDLQTPTLPQAAVRALYAFDALGQISAEVVYVPVFVPHRVRVYGSDYAPTGVDGQFAGLSGGLRLLVPRSIEEDIQPLLIAFEPPDESPDNGSAGGRLLFRGSGWDLRLNAFYGWDRVPSLRINPSFANLAQAFADPDFNPATDGLALISDLQNVLQALQSGERVFTTRYKRQLTLGLDGVVVAGDFAFKADATFSPRRTVYTEQFRPVDSAVVSWAGGVDWLPDPDVLVTVEIFGFSTLDAPPDGGDYLLIGRHFPNLVTFARWAITDDFEISHSLRVGLEQGDLLASPRLSWLPADGHTLVLGATFFEGPEDSVGGLYDANDLVFGQYVRAF